MLGKDLNFVVSVRDVTGSVQKHVYSVAAAQDWEKVLRAALEAAVSGLKTGKGTFMMEHPRVMYQSAHVVSLGLDLEGAEDVAAAQMELQRITTGLLRERPTGVARV